MSGNLQPIRIQGYLEVNARQGCISALNIELSFFFICMLCMNLGLGIQNLAKVWTLLLDFLLFFLLFIFLFVIRPPFSTSFRDGLSLSDFIPFRFLMSVIAMIQKDLIFNIRCLQNIQIVVDSSGELNFDIL